MLTDILCSSHVSVYEFFFSVFTLRLRLPLVKSSTLLLLRLIHQALASIASQDYPIQHGVWEKTLFMADTLLISFK